MIERIPNHERERIDTITFGLYLPGQILTNQRIERWRVTTPGGNPLTADSIEKRTGVQRRHIAKPFETVSYMAIQAAKDAMGRKRKISYVLATTSHPDPRINLSQEINHDLNLKAITNHDIYAACSGFAKTLHHIKAHEAAFMGHSILLVSSEKYSDKVYDLRRSGTKQDPSLSQTIFSDGAVAMHFTYGKDFRILSAKSKTLPFEYSSAIRVPIKRAKIPTYTEEFVFPSTTGKFEQDGKRVYRAVMESVPDLIQQTLDEAELEEKDIKLVIPHQGSGHIIEGLQSRLNMPVFNDIKDGNFSSASIPKAFLKARNAGRIHRRDKVVIAGFGAGLYASVAVVELH